MNKQGVTPIIAVVLLLMITVAVAGTVSFWLSSVTSGTQRDIEESVNEMADKTQTPIQIEFKKCAASGSNNVQAQIRNIGTKTISQGDISVVLAQDNVDLWLGRNGTAIPIAGVGSDEDITVSWTWDSIAGDGTYTMKITMPNGAAATDTCTVG